MPIFQIDIQANEMVVTEDPIITVDAGLPPGQYRFQLIVEDDRGVQSLPVEAVVTVREAAKRIDEGSKLIDEG